MVGLCFTEKQIAPNQYAAYLIRQAGVEHASEVARIYWSGVERDRSEGRNGVTEKTYVSQTISKSRAG